MHPVVCEGTILEVKGHTMNWLRLHSEARTDRKLDLLTDQQHRIWFNLLCLASEGKDRGTIEYPSMDMLAIEVSRGDVVLLEQTLAALVKYKMVDHAPGTINFINWNKRQYNKPSDTPEETRKRKAKQRDSASVDDVSRDVTPDHATYTDTEQIINRADTEQNKPPSSVPRSPNGATKTAKPKTIKRSIPEDWEPPERLYEIGKDIGLNEYQVDTEMIKFRAHAEANERKLANWDQGARLWLENSLNFMPKHKTGGHR